MSTRFQKRKYRDVGDVGGPRTRPRVGDVAGAAYYVGAAHVNVPPTNSATDRPRQQTTSTDDYAYRWPGNPDRDEARALAEFNAALQRAIDAVDWSQPF